MKKTKIDIWQTRQSMDNLKTCQNMVISYNHCFHYNTHSADTGHTPVYNSAMTGIAEGEEALATTPTVTTTATTSSEPIRAQLEVFTVYVNLALARALSERFARWDPDFIDPQSCKEPTDSKTGKPMGVQVFEAYSLSIWCGPCSYPCLEWTVDLCAKAVRTASVLDQLYDGRDPYNYSRFNTPREQDEYRRRFKGKVVIYMTDKAMLILWSI